MKPRLGYVEPAPYVLRPDPTALATENARLRAALEQIASYALSALGQLEDT